MRLIDVKTLELKEFFGSKTPRYAILSHTWGDQEVTFQEWERRSDSAVKRKDGYAKIVGACHLAKADGLQYLWCDTNCIDKRSSAELSEAINSMFAWYHGSSVCYAYLADVQAKTDTFTKSRWFTRGWTLQELLAPSKVIFLDSHWAVLGDRSELACTISEVTRIHIEALKDRSTIYDYSIAQRMSWAADRETSRQEDIAYCLLGIFDINMPLLYGEGQKAFTRLQQEIIRVSNDQSILAWDMQCSDTCPWTSALAHSPAEFRFCDSIVKNSEIQRKTYSVTNLGIHIKTSLIKTLTGTIVFIMLNCAKELYREARHSKLTSGMRLRRHFPVWIALHYLKGDIFVRTHHLSSKMFFGDSYSILEFATVAELFLSLDASPASSLEYHSSHAGLLRQHSSATPSGVLVMISAGKTMYHDARILRQPYPLGAVSILQLKGQGASTVSHQLISSGDLSMVFSVFWNGDRIPQEWLHTTIFDPQLKISSEMRSHADWKCLFGCGCTQATQHCNSATGMRSLHERLRRVYGESFRPYITREKDPIVIAEDQPMLDSFGQPELIVDIIFREPLRVVRLLKSTR
ncbi:HET-domain-containing protein [Hypoxylon sp. FL0543]|nr:HET-domain-containing protein [Hypoxylon sp. FL0543]